MQRTLERPGGQQDIDVVVARLEAKRLPQDVRFELEAAPLVDDDWRLG